MTPSDSELFPIPERPMFSIRQLGGITGMERTFLEEWAEERAFEFRSPKAGRARRKGGETEKRTPQGERPTLRVPRPFVVSLFVQSARFTVEALEHEVAGLAHWFGAAACRRIANAFGRRAEQLERRAS